MALGYIPAPEVDSGIDLGLFDDFRARGKQIRQANKTTKAFIGKVMARNGSMRLEETLGRYSIRPQLREALQDVRKRLPRIR
jgi:hypothetical protein